MVNEFIDTCNPGCSAASPHNPTPTQQETPTPTEVWEICYADFRGPIGGDGGWYVHTLMDAYSRYPISYIAKAGVNIYT